MNDIKNKKLLIGTALLLISTALSAKTITFTIHNDIKQNLDVSSVAIPNILEDRAAAWWSTRGKPVKLEQGTSTLLIDSDDNIYFDSSNRIGDGHGRNNYPGMLSLVGPDSGDWVCSAALNIPKTATHFTFHLTAIDAGDYAHFKPICEITSAE